MYVNGRKSIVIAFNQGGDHYEAIGVQRQKKEIYDFEFNDPFIIEINKYINFSSSSILSVPLFSMREYVIKKNFEASIQIPLENKGLSGIKDDLDNAKVYTSLGRMY